MQRRIRRQVPTARSDVPRRFARSVCACPILALGACAHMARVRTYARMIFDGRGPPLPPAARPDPKTWSSDDITGSCLGHSTVLMNFLGVRILTDPVFSTRVGLGFPPLVLGPKRHLRPALRPREFAAPDVILLSHAHFDHFDVASLRKFSRDTPVVTARHTGDLLRYWRFREI